MNRVRRKSKGEPDQSQPDLDLADWHLKAKPQRPSNAPTRRVTHGERLDGLEHRVKRLEEKVRRFCPGP